MNLVKFDTMIANFMKQYILFIGGGLSSRLGIACLGKFSKAAFLCLSKTEYQFLISYKMYPSRRCDSAYKWHICKSTNALCLIRLKSSPAVGIKLYIIMYLCIHYVFTLYLITIVGSMVKFLTYV